MKVLVVEGNIVMMEIISDVLSVDGFTVTTATTASDAETKFCTFLPEVVVFDIDTKGANIVNFIGTIKKVENVRIIAICNSRSDAPSHAVITDYIVKPFKGSEVLMAVRKAKNDIETRNKKARKFTSLFGGLFNASKTPVVSKPKEEVPVPRTPIVLEKTGKSYIIFEEYPNKIYGIAKRFLATDTRLFVLTQDKIMNVKTRFPDAMTTIVGLSKRPKEGYITYSKLGSIMGELGEFTKNNVNGVVVVEGVEIMIANHGMSTVVTMMCQLVDNGYATGTIFLFSVKPETFSENEKSLLLHHLDFYSEAAEGNRRQADED